MGELSLQQLGSIVAAAPVAIYTVTTGDVVRSWNPACERLFGWRADEVIGQRLPIVPEDAPAQAEHERLTRKVLAAESMSGLELRRRTRDGEVVDVSVALAPLHDERGVVVGVIGMVQDIGARLHQLRVILDAIPAPIFYKDADGIYSGCNQAFMAYLGRTREEIVGKSVYEVAPKDLADIYREADLALFRSRDVQIYEASVRYADGSRHDVIFNKATFLDSDGQLGGLVGTILDITARKHAERALAASEERYRAAVSALEEGIVVIASDGQLLACNPAAERILGLRPGAIERRLLAASGWHTEADTGGEAQVVPLERLPVMTTLATGQADSAAALAFDREDGARVWIAMSSRPLFHPGEQEPFAVVASFADISERRRAQERLHHLAFHDPLTGLPNRVLFLDRLTHALAVSLRTGVPLAVVCMDLDRFKAVNDTLGHHAGDLVLCDVATRLLRAARQSDTIARVGGDEFMAILPGIGDVAGAEAAARRMLDALRPVLQIEGREQPILASVGVTLAPRDGAEVGVLMRRADRAMYRAKQEGQHGFRVFSAEDA